MTEKSNNANTVKENQRFGESCTERALWRWLPRAARV